MNIDDRPQGGAAKVAILPAPGVIDRDRAEVIESYATGGTQIGDAPRSFTMSPIGLDDSRS